MEMRCTICGNDAEGQILKNDSHTSIECCECGHYIIADSAIMYIRHNPEIKDIIRQYLHDHNEENMVIDESFCKKLWSYESTKD